MRDISDPNGYIISQSDEGVLSDGLGSDLTCDKTSVELLSPVNHVNNESTYIEDGLDDVYITDNLFDFRLDELPTRTLFVSSVVSRQEDRTLKSHVVFVGIAVNHLCYNIISFKPSASKLFTPGTYVEYVTSNIFSRTCADIQLDEGALVDASWECESLDLCKKIKLYLECQGIQMTDYDREVCAMNKIGDDLSISEDIRILDCTCGNGGNLVHFSNTFDLSIGIEISKTRAEICRNNLSVYGVDSKAVVVEDDFFTWAQKFLKSPADGFNELGYKNYKSGPYPFHWTFISPPWGGKHYRGANSPCSLYSLKHESCMDVGSAVTLASQLSLNVTINLPRSQSLAEIIEIASNNGFTLMIIDSYSTSQKNKHIRCAMVHMMRDLRCLDVWSRMYDIESSWNRRFSSKKSVHELLLTPGIIKDRSKLCKSIGYGCFKLLPINPKHSILWNNLKSSMSLQYITYGISSVLKETCFRIYTKLSIVLQLSSLIDILKFVNLTIETQFAGGLLKAASGTTEQARRTTCGVFFHLIKINNKSLYNKIESHYKIK